MKKLNRIWTFLIIILGLVTVLTHSCKKANNSVPVLTTSDISQITQNTASSGGTISSDGGSSITSRGVCWGKFTAPTISSSITTDGTGTGNFISNLTGLSPNTTHYVRAYATNSIGTGYGNEISFKTSPADTIAKDPDGNIYHLLTIGTQVWMVENLKTTKYADGTSIPTTTPATLDISSESAPKYQWAPNGDESNVAIYGRIYTGYAITNNNACPTGWHVPTDAEWTTLTDYLGGISVAGGKLKEAGTAHWESPNTDATNSSGFTALPSGGGRGSNGTFGVMGREIWFWSSTETPTGTLWDRALGAGDAFVHKDDTPKVQGFFVRCIQTN